MRASPSYGPSHTSAIDSWDMPRSSKRSGSAARQKAATRPHISALQEPMEGYRDRLLSIAAFRIRIAHRPATCLVWGWASATLIAPRIRASNRGRQPVPSRSLLVLPLRWRILPPGYPARHTHAQCRVVTAMEGCAAHVSNYKLVFVLHALDPGISDVSV